MLLGISEWSLSSPRVAARGGVFSGIYRGNLVELLVVSPTIWNRYPMMGPSDVLTLRFVHTEPPVTHQLPFSFPYLALVLLA